MTRDCASHETLRALQQQSRVLCMLQQHSVHYEYVYHRLKQLRAPVRAHDRSASHFA